LTRSKVSSERAPGRKGRGGLCCSLWNCSEPGLLRGGEAEAELIFFVLVLPGLWWLL
jgi:hypothetical protein